MLRVAISTIRSAEPSPRIPFGLTPGAISARAEDALSASPAASRMSVREGRALLNRGSVLKAGLLRPDFSCGSLLPADPGEDGAGVGDDRPVGQLERRQLRRSRRA